VKNLPDRLIKNSQYTEPEFLQSSDRESHLFENKITGKIIFSLLLSLFLTSSAFAAYLEVPIEGTIDGGLAEFVERNMERTREMHYEGVIFHVNTPGGRLDSAVRIRDLILAAKVPTIAFVERSAISAGALITLACDSIYMAPGSSIGAATAVDLEGKKASEKVISYMRSQMRATAEAKGRRPDLAQAMVDEDMAIEGLTVKGKLLTLTYEEALKVHISDGTVSGVPDVLSRLGKPWSEVVTARINWAERVVRFLTDPIVSSLLMSLGFLGLLIELKTPGFGLGGAIAVIAFTLFFGSHYIVKLAGIWELLFLIAGLTFLLLEIFVFPGFGVAGVTGIALVLISLFFSLLGTMPGKGDFAAAVQTLGWTFLITVGCGVLLIRFLPKSTLFRRMTMSMVENSGDGFASAETETGLIGKTGTALSNLRPAGKADIEGRRLDVVTEGGYILRGATVVVTEVNGARIVVKEG
jgi:membrane-bound serine protease (ClpP class)